MTGQLESPHFYREGDLVCHADGRGGIVVEARSLYATIRWDGGDSEEIDQFDREVTVVARSA